MKQNVKSMILIALAVLFLLPHRASASDFTSQLSSGSQGEEVKKLQTVLAQYPDIYPQGLITGWYGPLTTQAVRKFQNKFGISPVGVVGPLTRKKLNELFHASIMGELPVGVPLGNEGAAYLKSELERAFAEIENLKSDLGLVGLGQMGSRGFSGGSGATGATGAKGLMGATGLAGATASAGLEFLGSKVLAAGATTTGALAIPARDMLFVMVRVVSYGSSPNPAGDTASFRFNGDAGPNYWSRHLFLMPGETTFGVVENIGVSLIRLAEGDSTLSRNVILTINNRANRGKTVNIKNQTGTANALQVGVLNIAGGEWVNTVDQITSIEMLNAGLNNMGTGSGFAVYGVNF